MFLKKFVYVNWGNIPATEFARFKVWPINLFSVCLFLDLKPGRLNHVS